MSNGKGSMRRPIGRITEAELARNWKRTFGSTKRPRNKRVAVAKLREAEAAGNLNAMSPRLSPAEFSQRERANAAALGFTDQNVRLEAVPHDAECGCATCVPRTVIEHTDGAAYSVPASLGGAPAPACAVCEGPLGEAAGDTCPSCLSEIEAAEDHAAGERITLDTLAASLEPVAPSVGPLAPVTPEVEHPEQDRAARRRAHRGR